MPRHPMTPAEFDDACRLLWATYPNLSETSGRRSAARNSMVRGHPMSKHVLGMARDFVGPMETLVEAEETAIALGLWTKLHDVGSGDHLHVQGLPVGLVAEWWDRKYGQGVA